MGKYRNSDMQWKFSSIEELVEHIAQMLDIEPQSKQSIRGTSSQLEFLKEDRINGSRSALFNNPILNYITSPHGEIIIGSQSYNIRARRLRSPMQNASTHRITNGSTVTYSLDCYEDATGLVFCQSEDGRIQSYSDNTDSVQFESYRDSGIFYSEIGTKISTVGPYFEAANIDSRYFGEAYAQTCTVHKYDQDSDTNRNYLDEYEWNFGSQSLIRVESLCRVQWNGRRLSGVVSAGEYCFVVGGVDPWPLGVWPEDWPPLNEPEPIESIVITPRALTFTSRPPASAATRMITIKSTHTTPVVVTIGEATLDETTPPTLDRSSFGGTPLGAFSNTSGQLTIPPNGSIRIGVTFTGESGLGTIHGSLRISWSNGLATIRLTGTLLRVAQQ